MKSIDDIIHEYEAYGFDVSCTNAVVMDTMVWCVYLVKDGKVKNMTFRQDTLKQLC